MHDPHTQHTSKPQMSHFSEMLFAGATVSALCVSVLRGLPVRSAVSQSQDRDCRPYHASTRLGACQDVCCHTGNLTFEGVATVARYRCRIRVA